MYNNPYFNNQRYQPIPINNQPLMSQPYQPIQPITPPQSQPIGLLGKIVDSIDVVKGTEIPLDGSVSYFPLSDGSSIITKQLQMDGTSKIIIYKPCDDEPKNVVKYVTIEELENKLSNLEISDLEEIKEEIKDIRKQLKSKKGKDN